MTLEKKIRVALLLVLSGLAVQLLALLYWTPLTFILFAVFGVTLVLLGAGYFSWTVWRKVEGSS